MLDSSFETKSAVQYPKSKAPFHQLTTHFKFICMSSLASLSSLTYSTDLVMYFEKVRRKSVVIKCGFYRWNIMKRSTFAWLVFLCLLLQCYFLFLVQQQSTHLRHKLIPERKTKNRGEFYHFLERVSQVLKRILKLSVNVFLTSN